MKSRPSHSFSLPNRAPVLQSSRRHALAALTVAVLTEVWLVSLLGCRSSVTLPTNEHQRFIEIDRMEERPEAVPPATVLEVPAADHLAHRVEKRAVSVDAVGVESAVSPGAAKCYSLEQLFSEHDVIRRDTAAYTRRLLERLPAHDAAHISLLHELHSTGQFLRELERWRAEAGNGDFMEPDAKEELRQLAQRWRAWQRNLITAMNAEF